MPVSVRFAPESRGPSSKQARFIRRWRRFVCFPFLGYLRAKSRLTAVAPETRLRAQSRTPPSLPSRKIYHFIDGLKTHADKTHVSLVRTSPIRSPPAEQGSGHRPSFSLHFCNKRTFSLLFPPFMLN